MQKELKKMEQAARAAGYILWQAKLNKKLLMNQAYRAKLHNA
ncbi:hypothetical protein MASR2M36_36730 [Providencia sp.]